jgi:integrase
MLDEFLDEARPVYRLTRADINGFKRALAETPSSYVKRFPNLKLPEAIKANKARKEPYPVLHHRTINDKYLSKLHSLLNWCVRNEIIPDNPATGIKVASLKGSTERPRVDFSPDDLTRLFGPKHFDRTKPLDEFQWAMLIALFSGTRASELAQIKLNSVQHHRGVLALAIEEQTKNLGSQRLIPVHSTLINMGLEQRVAQLRKQGETHLFPKWYRDGVAAKERATSRNSMANNQYFVRFIPKRFNNSYLPKVGIHDPRKTWHSFRHSFKSGLARAGVPRDMSDALTGHADHSAGGGYVHGASVEAMKEAIEKLRIDGFDLATP